MWAQVIAPGSNVFDKLCDALYLTVFLPFSVCLLCSLCLPLFTLNGRLKLPFASFLFAWQQSGQLLLYFTTA